MAQTFTDQFFLMDPANPPPAGTTLGVVKLSLTDQNDDNDFDRFNNDSINGSDIRSSWPGDTVTVNVPGVGNVTYTGTTFYLANGQQVFAPNDGQVLEGGSFVSSTWVNTQGPLLVKQLGPPCFVAGTLIDTPDGRRPVERLRPGDSVLTLDGGVQPLRWAGRRVVAGRGSFAPVRFAAGVLGNDRPLLVSPQHRVLLGGPQVALLFGAHEVLAAAVHLVDGGAVTRAPQPCVAYHHLLFDGHALVRSNGAASESFFPGDTVLRGDGAIRTELAALFPGLAAGCGPAAWRTARRVLRGHEARALRGASVLGGYAPRRRALRNSAGRNAPIAIPVPTYAAMPSATSPANAA